MTRAAERPSGRQRFISEDPTGLSAGPNLYAYVDDDPVSFRDPFGLQGRPDWTEMLKDAWNVGPYDAARAKRMADQSFIDAAKGTRRGQTPWERAMDEANNAAGRNCAAQVDPEGKRRDCADTCMQLLWKGGLYGPGGIPFQVWTNLGSFR